MIAEVKACRRALSNRCFVQSALAAAFQNATSISSVLHTKLQFLLPTEAVSKEKNARVTPTNNPYALNNFRTDNSTYAAINYDTDALLARLPDSIKIMLSDYANTTRLPDARATSLPMTFFQQTIPAIFSLQSQSASAPEATRAFITTGTSAYAAVKQPLSLQ